MCHVVGIYSERSVGPSYVVTQRLYIHRSLKSLIVVEVDLERFDVNEPLQLNIELNRWTVSYDFTFVTHDTGRNQVRSAVHLHLSHTPGVIQGSSLGVDEPPLETKKFF